jgi:hypothetical protein
MTNNWSARPMQAHTCRHPFPAVAAAFLPCAKRSLDQDRFCVVHGSKTSCTFTTDVGNAWVVHIRIRAGSALWQQPVSQALERVVFRLAGKYTRAPSEPGKAAILPSHVCQASRCHRSLEGGGEGR